MDPELEVFVWSRHSNALSLGVRPGFTVSWFDAAPELHRRVAFTPALVLGYWLTPPPTLRPSLAQHVRPARLEGGGGAFELPIGIWQDLDRDQPTGFFVGFGGRLALPVD